MESGAVNNFDMIMKQIAKFDGRRADEILEWNSKFHASFSVYKKTTPNVLQTKAEATAQIQCRLGDHSHDLGCFKSRLIQRTLLHHSWFSVLRGSEVSGQNTG